MSTTLQGKIAVVTGASKGIGAQIARQLAAAGAKVVVNYASSKEGAEKVVADIASQGGKAVAVKGDVSKEADVIRLFEETTRQFGPVDILVNNAGIYSWGSLDSVTPENFHSQFNLNVLGLLLASREAAKQFGDRGGSIINVSSLVTTLTPPNSAVYAATKGAVDTITRVLAKELGPKKIRVNAVSPGLVETEGTTTAGFSHADNEFRRGYEAQAPLGRIGRPEDIAPAVVFLASQASGWMTGELIGIGGGVR